MTDAIREKTGYDITGQSEEQLRAKPASASASKSTTRWARAS